MSFTVECTLGHNSFANATRISLASKSGFVASNTASVDMTSLSQYSATLDHSASGTGLSHGRPSSLCLIL